MGGWVWVYLGGYGWYFGGTTVQEHGSPPPSHLEDIKNMKNKDEVGTGGVCVLLI